MNYTHWFFLIWLVLASVWLVAASYWWRQVVVWRKAREQWKLEHFKAGMTWAAHIVVKERDYCAAPVTYPGLDDAVKEIRKQRDALTQLPEELR